MNETTAELTHQAELDKVFKSGAEKLHGLCVDWQKEEKQISACKDKHAKEIKNKDEELNQAKD